MNEYARYAADLARAAAAVEPAADEAELRVARGAAQTARSTVAVLTGETRASIRVVELREGHAVVADSEAALFLEYGTSTMAPQPFIGPALVRWGPELFADVEEIRDDVVEALT